MPSLPPSSKYLQRASEPVDDVERESLTQRLSDAFADGRLQQDDYMAALDTVYGAATLGDLVPVVEQLPAAAADVPAIVQVGASVPAGEVAPSRNLVGPAVMVVGGFLVSVIILAVLLVLIL